MINVLGQYDLYALTGFKIQQ